MSVSAVWALNEACARRAFLTRLKVKHHTPILCLNQVRLMHVPCKSLLMLNNQSTQKLYSSKTSRNIYSSKSNSLNSYLKNYSISCTHTNTAVQNIFNVIYVSDAKHNFHLSLRQSSVSHNPSEIISIC